MIDMLLSLMVLLAGGLWYTLYVASRAPVGHQDEQGFHLGQNSAQNTEDFPAPVPELSR
jgi:hypothetical protein